MCMQLARVAAILLVLATSIVPTVHAQYRGRATTRPQTPSASRPSPPSTPRPSIPSAGPRPVPRPVTVVPFWLPWGFVTIPELILLGPLPVIEGAPTGGLQLDVQPWSADVYVDGALAGRVEQFRGYYQHLVLPGGPHIISIVAEGYEPLVFAVTVVPGKTITHRAALLR